MLLVLRSVLNAPRSEKSSMLSVPKCISPPMGRDIIAAEGASTGYQISETDVSCCNMILLSFHLIGLLQYHFLWPERYRLPTLHD
jgi:hypothetical protein